MIVGTGIDMIEVERVGDKINKGNGFLERIFSEREIEYCNKKINKYEHYAARFAAKEAFLKATGKGLLTGFDLHLIELIPNEDGKPQLFLKGIYEQMFRDNNWNKIHVSLSHLNNIACAMVIIEA
jgi:holo-[acyl-carrier protein] synthase